MARGFFVPVGQRAKVLLGRTDYKDAVTHFAGEFRRDPAGAKPYTAAVFDEMAKSSPQQAVQFMGQMKAAGLVEETKAEPPSAPTPAPAPAPAPAQTPPSTPPANPQPAPVPTPKPEPAQKGKILSPVPNPTVRGDDSGDGGFGARRDGGKRQHKGVDLEAEAGTQATSPIKGKVEHIGPAYKDPNAYGGGYQAIHIRGDDGRLYTMRYVSPNGEDGKPIVQKGQSVEAGQSIGRVQDRASKDKEGRKDEEPRSP